MKRWILSGLLLAVAASWSLLSAEEISVRGRVFCDKQGIEGVWVSDGEHFAQTDSNGCYTLTADNDNRFLFVCLPAGYEVPMVENVVRHFMPLPESDSEGCDFELLRRKEDDTRHTLIATADPQIWAEKEFAKLELSAAQIREEREQRRNHVIHGICLGDIVANNHSFYPQYNATMAQTGIPFRHVMGNHDMSLYIRSHEGSSYHYGLTFGPEYYSFDVGEVHYVMLNDNFYIGRDWYYIAYLEERQMKWLAEDLSHQKPGQTVVVCMHIPSTCTAEDRGPFEYARIEGSLTNYKGLYELLEPFNAHILSGHTHTAFNSPVRENLYDHVIPALSGAWWQGELCTDGTPAGYAVFEFDGGSVSWHYRSVGYDRNHQMRLYSGTEEPEFVGYAVANIWNCDEGWEVEFLFDGEPATHKAERFTAYDPAARRLYANRTDLDHQWIGPTPSDHFFRVPLPEGVKRIEVRATDRFGRTYTERLKLKR